MPPKSKSGKRKRSSTKDTKHPVETEVDNRNENKNTTLGEPKSPSKDIAGGPNQLTKRRSKSTGKCPLPVEQEPEQLKSKKGRNKDSKIHKGEMSRRNSQERVRGLS